MQFRERVVDLLLVPMVLLLGGLVAMRLESDVSHRLSSPDTAYGAPIPEGNPVDGPSQTDRVVLLVVDSFSLDAVRRAEMPELRAFEAEAARIALLTRPPAELRPVLLSMLTGADREIHGVAADFATPSIDLLARLDNLPLSVRHDNRRLRVFPTAGFARQLDVLRPLAQWVEADDPTTVGETFAAESTDDVFRLSPRPALDIVHLSGSAFGAKQDGGRVESLEIARKIDRQFAAILGSIDLASETFAVVFLESRLALEDERARSPRSTPLMLFAGRAVRAEVSARALPIDVAPTFALLLGLPFSSSNLGQPMLDMLELPSPVIESRLADLERQKADFRTFAATEFRLGDDALRVGAENRVIAARARQYRAIIAPQILMAIAIAALLIGLTPRFDRLLTVASGSACGGILLMAYMAMRKSRFDLSRLSTNGGYETFAGALLLYGLLMSLVLAFGAAWFMHRQHQSGSASIARSGLLAAFGCSVILWSVATLSWLRFDMPATGTPELNRWTLTYAAALRILVPLSFAAVPATLIATLIFGRSAQAEASIGLDRAELGLASRGGTPPQPS